MLSFFVQDIYIAQKKSFYFAPRFTNLPQRNSLLLPHLFLLYSLKNRTIFHVTHHIAIEIVGLRFLLFS